MIIRGLSAHPSIEVIGYAINTLDAKVKIPKLNPDVITMDVEMPGKSGIHFLKEYLPSIHFPANSCLVAEFKSVRRFRRRRGGLCSQACLSGQHGCLCHHTDAKSPDRICRQGSVHPSNGGNFPNAGPTPLCRPSSSGPGARTEPGSDRFGRPPAEQRRPWKS
ncbi:MAG: hypothetical protein V8R75_01120 [Oscillospiraceae bacterium]